MSIRVEGELSPLHMSALPVKVKHVAMVNFPFLLRGLYKVFIKPFLSTKIRQRLHFHSEATFQAPAGLMTNPSSLPVFFDGGQEPTSNMPPSVKAGLAAREISTVMLEKQWASINGGKSEPSARIGRTIDDGIQAAAAAAAA